MLIAAAAVLGLLVAWTLGADLARLADLRIRGTWLVFVALATQLAVFTPWSPTLPDSVAVGLHLASYALLLVFLVLNVRLPGLPIAAAGFACNLLVIAANGGRMPVDADDWSQTAGAVDNNVVLADSHTNLAWLGDTIPIPAHPIANTLSIGDLILLAGIAIFIHGTCLRRRIDPAEQSVTAA
jgi:hypothetical protein